MRGMFKDKEFIKMLLRITLPIGAQNLINVAVQMADTVMMGAVGQTQLSAASLANQPFFVFSILVFGLASGASVLNAQYWGKGEIQPIKIVTTLVMRVAMAVALLLTVLVLLFPVQVMRIYTPEQQVIDAGVEYLRIIAFSYILFGLSATFFNTMRSIAVVKIALVNSIATLFINVFLNWVLIFGHFGLPAMGIRGAALATLISRFVEFTIAFIYAFFIDKKLMIRPRDFLSFDKGLVLDYFKYGLPVVINELMWSLGVSIQSMILGRMGEATVSASQIASVVQQLSTIFVFGVANAAAVLVGNAVGAGEVQKARDYARWLKWVSVFVGIASAAVIFLIRDFAVGFYNVPEETKELAREMLVVLCFLVFFISISAVGIVGILRGGGDARFAAICDVLSLWLVAVPAGLLAAFVFHAPVLVVYACTKVDEVVKDIAVFWRLRNGNWIKDVTRDYDDSPVKA